jgi:hypothetical protein
MFANDDPYHPHTIPIVHLYLLPTTPNSPLLTLQALTPSPRTPPDDENRQHLESSSETLVASSSGDVLVRVECRPVSQ